MNKIELTPAFLSDLKEKAEKATPVPWRLTNIPDVTDVLASNTRFVVGSSNKFKDAAFIAAANPAVVLALIEKIERLEKENEELRANNYGPEILNDPQALTSCYFAGRMAEGRDKNREMDKLLEEKERLQKLVELWRHDYNVLTDHATKLEKEAAWLADFCKKFCQDYRFCNECALYPESCPKADEITFRFKKYEVLNWRQAARKAVSEDNENSSL